jgi:predicted ATP-dependent endonuclease of OLD family
MKLKSFSITNFRSIKSTKKIQIDNYNVLIGPNNEGKSNILRGLVTALSLATTGDYKQIRRGSGYSRSYYYSDDRYNWQRDIPFEKKEDESAKTTFTLEFEFTSSEKGLFKKDIGLTLRTPLSLKLQLAYKISDCSYEIKMPGKAKKTFTANQDKIAAFIKEKIDFQYIPCIRTEELTYRVIEQLLQRALLSNTQYQRVLNRLQRIQEPILRNIQVDSLSTIKEFIPEIISLTIEKNNRFREFNSKPTIIIDDGTLTSIEEKGDGMKSLLAISLMRYAASNSQNKNLIILIEEPESHLHPRAIHSLKKVLIDFSKQYQIIISSHSQLLVDKLNIQNNVIVQKRAAKHATNIRQIRDSLGVEVSDNLVTANFIILLEGQSDVRFFEKILTEKSTYYSKLKEKGRVVLGNLQGCSKAAYKASMYKNLLLEVFLILDSDSEGLLSLKEVIEKGILSQSETLKVVVPGMSKAELEDLYDYNLYKEMILNDYCVNIDTTNFKRLSNPWSDRIKREFELCGQTWNESIEKDLKEKIADLVVEKGYDFIHSARKQFIDNVIQVLDNKFEKIK